MLSNASLAAAVRLLADFAKVMRKWHLRWYVFGAQAAAAYGRPRMTADVDVTIELRKMSARALLNELSEAGFFLRIDLDDEFLLGTRLWPLVHAPTAMPLDVVLAASTVHMEFLDRRRFVDIGRRRIPMISPEDLVVTKVLAGRRKDFEDLRGVLREQTTIDHDRIRRLLAELDAALGGDRLSRRFERLVRTTLRK